MEKTIWYSIRNIPPARGLDTETGTIIWDEVNLAIRKLKDYKTLGKDGLVPVMFKVTQTDTTCSNETIQSGVKVK